jgi:hypothetical protein
MSYKMKHDKSAFPFKSPVKQSQQYTETPDAGPYGRWNRGTGGATPQSTGAFRNPGTGFTGGIGGTMLLGMRRKDQEPTPTPEEYEAQGLNKWGGTDLSI